MPRNHYTVDQKLAAIQFAEIHGNTAAGRALGVDESLIRSWRSKKTELEKLPPNRSTLRHGTVKNPGLELQLQEWVTSQNAKGRPVTVVSLRFKALALAKEGNIRFNAGPSWAQRFLRRSGLQKMKIRKGPSTIDSAPGSTEPDFTGIDNITRHRISLLSHDFIQPMVTNPKIHLQNKFRRCEQAILGVVTSNAAEVEEPVCDERDLRIKALEAIVARLQDRLDRLDPDGIEEESGEPGGSAEDLLEAAVARQQARLDRLDPDGAESDTGEPTAAELRRENAVLKRKIRLAEREEAKKRPVTTPTRGSRGRPARTATTTTKSKKRSSQTTDDNGDSDSYAAESGNYPCPDCTQQFTSLSTLQRHLKQHPRGNEVVEEASEEADVADVPDVAVPASSFHCPFCMAAFELRGPLQNHLKKCPHRQQQRLDTPTNLLCQSCGETCANLAALHRHKKKCVAATTVVEDDHDNDHDNDNDQHQHQAALHVECEVSEVNEADGANETDDARLFLLANLIDPEGCAGDEDRSRDEDRNQTEEDDQMDDQTDNDDDDEEEEEDGDDDVIKEEPPEEVDTIISD